LHVALLSHEYPPFIYGGVATFVENLANGLRRRGVDVTVIAGYPVPRGNFKKFEIETEQVSSGINVIRYPYLNLPPRQLWFQVLNFSKLARTIQRLNADVIHGQSGVAYPALIALKNVAPTVISYHSDPKLELCLSLYSLTRGGSLSDLRTYAVGYPVHMYSFKREFEMSDAPVAVSDSLREEILRSMGKANSTKMSYIYNGVNVEEISKETSVSSEKDEYPTIFAGGRLYWRKGALNLVNLAYFLEKRHHLKYKIVVHGSGPLKEKMEMLIRKYGLTNIVLKGFTLRSEFLKDLKRSSFVVIPSVFEACPMLLLESMCLGKIPLMFRLPFSLELTKQGKYGILADNVEDMAAKIAAFDNNHDAAAFESKIREFAIREYDVNKTAARYQEIYQSIA
jgi:glycosyltransferase involved in cell wall biosynthesis